MYVSEEADEAADSNGGVWMREANAGSEREKKVMRMVHTAVSL